MATSYKTPGVYIEEIVKFPPSIAPVETAIPAFIGYTQTAVNKKGEDLTLVPTRISSLVEYESYFGTAQPETKLTVALTENQDSDGITTSIEAIPALTEANRTKHIMNYAMQLFFDNGGGPCWICSVGPYNAIAAGQIDDTELKDGLDKIALIDEPTILVFPEAQALDVDSFKTLHDAALLQCATLKDRVVVMDLSAGQNGDSFDMNDPDTVLLDAIGDFRDDGIGIDNLKYGAAYAPNIQTTLNFVVDETATVVSYKVKKEGSADVDTTPMLSAMQSGNNAAYASAKASINDMICNMPPAAAVAGIYARVDNDRGVWKSPANVGVLDALGTTIAFSNVQQDQMNVDTVAGKSVNAIRTFTGKGTLVWGGRTLAGNDNEWRYVNVRRFFNFVEESTKKATEQFVFEPNDANTWVRVQAMIENFLTTLWRQGALQGVKPEHAFYVAVGLGKTMTALDILEGRMIVEIGMAAVRPAEFIILRFSHKMAES